jgi:hypothetical protein
MIIKCRLCKREFDTTKQKRQHEKDAHPEGSIQYLINEAKKKVER